MKYFFRVRVQLSLLLIGIAWMWYIFHNSSLIIPVDFFSRLLELPFHTSGAILSRRQLTLYNLKCTFRGTPFEISEVRFSPLSSEKLFERWQCEIRNGTLETSFGTLNALNGIIQKNDDDYCSLLSAHHKNFGSLQGSCDSFRALQQCETYLKNSKSPFHGKDGKDFSFKNLQIHINGSRKKVSATYQIGEIGFGEARATSVFGQTYFDKEAAHIALQGQKIDTPQYSVHRPLADGTYAFPDAVSSMELQGFADIFHQNLQLYGRLQNFQPNADNNIQFAVNGGGTDGCGQLAFNLPQKQWSLPKARFIINPNVCNPIAKVVPHNPYQISFRAPLMLAVQGNPQQGSARLTASDFTVNNHPFKRAEVKVSKTAEQVFSWDATVQPPEHAASDAEYRKNNLRTHGTYDSLKHKGQVFCTGSVAPVLTDIREKYMPTWWDEFSSNFRFFEQNPYVDIAFQWNTGRKQTLFGYAEAQNGRYKQTNFKKLAVTFSHQPGYANLKIHRLQTTNGEGFCFIRWPYDPKDPQHEQFDFNGSGTFSVQRWETLIKDFVGISVTEYLKRLHPLIPTKASFKGCVSFPELPNDHLEVSLRTPTHAVDTVPVKDLDITYRQNAEEKQSTFSGLLFDTAPLKVQIHFWKETFDLNVDGEQLPLEPLLQQPMFAKWLADIPSDNLKTYNGLLDINVKANGRHKPEFSVNGEGFLDFKNPELSQIHLLGPLQKLLFTKIPFFPTFNFDRFTAEFSFDENEIRSQKAELTGPVARADVKGIADLKNHRLKGDLNFSFLDSQQIGIPIIRHAFRVLTPFTRVFSASVNGSFKDPKYFITLNPVRWALPKAPRPKKKP